MVDVSEGTQAEIDVLKGLYLKDPDHPAQVTSVECRRVHIWWDGAQIAELMPCTCGFVAILDDCGKSDTFPKHREAIDWILKDLASPETLERIAAEVGGILAGAL